MNNTVSKGGGPDGCFISLILTVVIVISILFYMVFTAESMKVQLFGCLVILVIFYYLSSISG